MADLTLEEMRAALAALEARVAELEKFPAYLVTAFQEAKPLVIPGETGTGQEARESDLTAGGSSAVAARPAPISGGSE